MPATRSDSGGVGSCNGLLRGIDLVVFPEVSGPGIRTSLHTKIVNADTAYKAGQTKIAEASLRAFVSEIEAQRGGTPPWVAG